MDKKEIVAFLEQRGTRRTVEGLARYGIQTERAFGVPMGTLLSLAKRIGKDHALAAELWESGCYEAPSWPPSSTTRSTSRAGR
jgi:3-methyladenine DNA glycosylase AlkD